MKRYAIIVAGGSGTRMHSSTPKQFLSLAGKPVLFYSLEGFYNFDKATEIIIALPADFFSEWEKLCTEYNFNIPHRLVTGGETRFHSVQNGLQMVNEKGIVGVHDAARPLVSTETISHSYEAAEKFGAAVPFVPLNDSIRFYNGHESRSLDRNKHVLVQTPQCFRSDVLISAYQTEFQPFFTDDASVVESSGFTVHLTEGNAENIKITTPSDFLIAETLVNSAK
jgi:2-C-methyl-D-erythritol 4-phosphate cytidylyltransferase